MEITKVKDIDVKKIYPSPEELCIINNSVQCPEKNCQEIFSSKSNLDLHLFKTHNRKEAINYGSGKTQFYCPDMACIYHSIHFFKNKKLLKQHYLKVHTPKNYACETCEQRFSSKMYKKMHADYCGIMFKCNDCPVKYPRYESLLTHARRKKHHINDKISFKLASMPTSNVSNNKKFNKQFKFLLPKPTSTRIIFISKNCNEKISQCIQTDQLSAVNCLDQKIQTKKCVSKEQTSKGTQTCNYSKAAVPEPSFEEQMSRSESLQGNNVSTQKCFLPSIHSGDSNTHYNIEPNLNNFDSNFYNCNTETQTDPILNDVFNYCDYYTNMYTQTCEDLLLDSLEFNDIETQTMDDVLRSVESQTTMSQMKKNQLNKDISHMETQTDLEFEHMLEAING